MKADVHPVQTLNTTSLNSLSDCWFSPVFQLHLLSLALNKFPEIMFSHLLLQLLLFHGWRLFQFSYFQTQLFPESCLFSIFCRCVDISTCGKRAPSKLTFCLFIRFPSSFQSFSPSNTSCLLGLSNWVSYVNHKVTIFKFWETLFCPNSFSSQPSPSCCRNFYSLSHWQEMCTWSLIPSRSLASRESCWALLMLPLWCLPHSLPSMKHTAESLLGVSSLAWNAAAVPGFCLFNHIF